VFYLETFHTLSLTSRPSFRWFIWRFWSR